MTPEEKKAAVKTAKIIRTARKLRGWTQIETAKKMDISQSALSKMESAILIPSAHQWFEFCSTAEIPADSYLQGYLDRMELISFQDKVVQKDFKVNDIYRKDAASSARSMAPLIQWLYSSIGEVKAKKLIKDMGVDPDYFVELGNQINFRFFVDLFQTMKKKGLYKKAELPQMTNLVSSQKAHGGLYAGNQQGASVESLLKTSFSKSAFYEVNFDYQIDDVQQNKISFTVSPKEHLLENKHLQFAEAREFIDEYRSGYFKNLIQYLNAKQALVKDVSCVSSEREKSVYEMRFAQ